MYNVPYLFVIVNPSRDTVDGIEHECRSGYLAPGQGMIEEDPVDKNGRDRPEHLQNGGLTGIDLLQTIIVDGQGNGP